ncbi:hypothetical protein JMA_42740 (plasmid) [Jeotgalibacillus malaysiensis]|uniref:Uncharacterized protein n=1 Tax=Jeotgalibacillus malaysiensis TaxID=1508404 RepID=A0A0B5AU51_9BACL|nr:hypothetical protein [Jeotgalibacillus malaysiensis]AJD93591.1 hypothetical protein JMA_42740 [Jeotgalibacillus malaysiensis]
MKKLTGFELTKALKAMEEREDLSFDVELEVETVSETEAKGHIHFMNVGWTYELKENVLFLNLDDAEAHWDGVMDATPEQLLEWEDEAQTTMEGLIEIGTVVSVK